MAAPASNTNATKWTEDRTLDYLKKIEKTACTSYTLTLGSALEDVRLYQAVWSYWKKRWADHEEIMETICFIEQIFINKLVEGGLTRRLHSGQCVFILRENFGYGKNKAETDREEQAAVYPQKPNESTQEEKPEVKEPAADVPNVTLTASTEQPTPTQILQTSAGSITQDQTQKDHRIDHDHRMQQEAA